MADTNEIEMNKDSWTLIASSGSGFVTNEASTSLFYREAATQPTATVEGHSLPPGDFVSYNLTGNSLWGRLKSGDNHNISITPNV